MRIHSVVHATSAVVAVVAASLVGPTAPAHAATLQLTSCASSHATSNGRLGTTPKGAATGAITGHAVTTAFALAGNDLVAAPPPAGYSPKVSFLQAGCELASALGIDNLTPGTGRLALATLTLRTDVRHALMVDKSVNSRIPSLGPVPTYQARVAWILISPTDYGCADDAQPTVSPYQVRAIDASTGASAVLFQDSLVCNGVTDGPSVTIPYQQVSLAWHLVSRSKGQGHAKVTAAWAACERFGWAGYRHGQEGQPYPTPVQQKHYDTTLAPYQIKMNHRPLWSLTVYVNRPIGPACGRAKEHLITVFPQELDKTLPAEMRHNPLGALITQRY